MKTYKQLKHPKLVIDEIINDISNNEWITPFKLSNQDIENNPITLLNYIDCMNECKVCESYKQCPFENKGYTNVLNINDDYITLRAVRCDKKPGAYDTNLDRNIIQSITVEDIIQEGREDILQHFKLIYNEFKNTKKITHKGIMLFGNYGRGKSFISYAMVNKLNELGLNTAIIFVPDLIKDVRKQNRNLKEIYSLSKYKTVDVLMLDDLFANDIKSSYGIEDIDDILLPILHYRMEHNKLTFITTNHNLDSMEKVIGNTVKAKRLLERIKKLCKPFRLDGENKRDD